MTDSTQTQIVKNASALFKQYGIRSVSIDDVCHKIGISKKTFYFYFKQKEDLVDAVLTYREQNDEIYFGHLLENKTALDKLLFFIKSAKDVDSIHKYPPLIYDVKKYYPQIFEKHEVYRRNLKQQIMSATLEQGISEGVYRKEVDTEAFCTFFTMQHNLLIENWLLYSDKITRERMMNFLIEIITSYLLSEQGKAELLSLKK